jgi:hypothetical protein
LADDGVTRARAALDASDYTGAQAALTEALASGTNGPDQLVEIYRMTGIVAGSLGDATGATQAFQHLLALSPKAALPAKTSHRITSAFADAAELFKTKPPLRVKLETAADAVTLVVVSDPLAMIARARVAATPDGQPEQTFEGSGQGRITIALPKGQRLAIRVAALDEHGNRLVELGTADVPLMIINGKQSEAPKPPPHDGTPPPPHDDTVSPPTSDLTASGPRSPRPLYARWWLWGSVTGAFALTGTYFVIAGHGAQNDLNALNANSTNHTFDEAKAAESRLSRDVLFTNISFGVAGAAGIAAAVLYFTGRSREHAIAAVPVRGGAAVAIEAHF